MSRVAPHSQNNIRHILITGASSGLGEALALHYAAPDITLSLSGRDQDRLEGVANNCRARGAIVDAQILCVTKREEMARWIIERDDVQPIDLLIANAGISGGTGGSGSALGDEAIIGETPAQVRQIFAVNVEGVFNTIDPILPRMVARKFGHIALMSSLAGFRGMPGAPAYCASKAAVKVYGESLHGMLKDKGVKIHVICPGFVKSRMTDENDFPMPFFMETPRAAKIIKKAIEKGRGRIVFPAPMYFAAWVLSALPDCWAQYLLKNSPSKSTMKSRAIK